MNRPSNYSTDVEELGKLKNNELYKIVEEEIITASIYHITKTQIGLWMNDNRKVIINKQWRISHRELKLGELIRFSMKKIPRHSTFSYPIYIEGRNNDTIPFEERELKKKSTMEHLNKVTNFKEGKMHIRILKINDKSMSFIWNGETFRIRLPRNKNWKNPKAGETIDIKIVSYEITRKIDNKVITQHKMIRDDITF